MKPFNLEEALKGAPVKLRDGCKAYVLADVSKLFPALETKFPLFGIHSEPSNHEKFSSSEAWTYAGTFREENGSLRDIIGMWEEPELTQEQILEKAYNENLKVTFPCAFNPDGYEVVGKLKSGDFVLRDGTTLFDSTPFNGYELYQEKPSTSTVTVTLLRPFKPEIGDCFYYIYSEPCSGILKVTSRKFDQDDANATTQDGNRFRTFDDAKAWLDAMKGVVDE